MAIVLNMIIISLFIMDVQNLESTLKKLGSELKDQGIKSLNNLFLLNQNYTDHKTAIETHIEYGIVYGVITALTYFLFEADSFAIPASIGVGFTMGILKYPIEIVVDSVFEKYNDNQ